MRLFVKTGYSIGILRRMEIRKVSKLCKDIDERVNAFLGRPLKGEWPYPGSTPPT